MCIAVLNNYVKSFPTIRKFINSMNNWGDVICEIVNKLFCHGTADNLSAWNLASDGHCMLRKTHIRVKLADVTSGVNQLVSFSGEWMPEDIRDGHWWRLTVWLGHRSGPNRRCLHQEWLSIIPLFYYIFNDGY